MFCFKSKNFFNWTHAHEKSTKANSKELKSLYFLLVFAGFLGKTDAQKDLKQNIYFRPKESKQTDKCSALISK